MKKGFTLIELLVVVLIIGIISAAALPQYQKAVDKTRLSTILPLLKALANAKDAYYLSTGETARTFDVLDIDIPADATIVDSDWYGQTAHWAKMSISLDAKLSKEILGTVLLSDGSDLRYYLPTVENPVKKSCLAPIGTHAEQLCKEMPGAVYNETASTTTHALYNLL